MNRRVEGLEEANPGSIVLNVDKRHGTGFVEGLLELGASDVGKPTIFAVVADDFGLRVYSGYSPPVLVVTIPWENTLSITRGDFALGMRPISRISVRVVVAKSRVVEIPITPNQVGWAIFNFSSRPRIESLVDQLNNRRGQSPSLANSESDRKR